MPTHGRVPLLFFILLAVSLPFELTTPLFMMGPLAISNIELLLFLALTSTTVSQIYYRRPLVTPPRYWLLLIPFLIALFLAALLAPQFSANALKAALRLTSGILLALAVIQWGQLGQQGPANRFIPLALLGGGLLATLLGAWEISQGEVAWLSLFRTQITRAGSFLRLTGSFAYANQAAMFIEATLPFLLAAAWGVKHGRGSHLSRRAQLGWLLLLFLLTLFYLQASLLTLSRASFATILLVTLAVSAVLFRSQKGWWWVGLASTTAVLLLANVLFSAQMRLRLQGGNVDEWYRATIIAPPTIEIPSGSTVTVPLTLTNQGGLLWDSRQEPHPIALGARWLNEEGQTAHGEARWPFPEPVRPGETMQINVPLTPPPALGTYTLRWDVVQEDVTWFGLKSGLFAVTQVTVVSATGNVLAPPLPPLVSREGHTAVWQYSGPVPNRTTLWHIALQMLWERPWLGIGLDNYRLTYNEWLDQPYADPTVHTNNTYLELLVSGGVFTAVPFFLWLAFLLVDIWRTLRYPAISMWLIAFAASLLAFVLHGLLDFFLLFNATGLLFWLLVGLWINEKTAYAHRV